MAGKLTGDSGESMEQAMAGKLLHQLTGDFGESIEQAMAGKLLPNVEKCANKGNAQTKESIEQALLKEVEKIPDKGSAGSVLNAIDKYAKDTPLPKHLDEDQCRILDDVVNSIDHRVVGLELGVYCGYSTIRIASKSANSNSKLISFEKDTFGVAEKMIEIAGMSSKVQLFKGRLNEGPDELQKFLDKMKAPYFNFIFMNHSGNSYLEDFKFLKQRRMLGKGTVIVANTKGHHQEYLKYVKEHRNEFETKANERGVNAPSMTVAIYNLSAM